MATIAETVAALERHLGFDAARCRTIIRKLIDAELIPSGAPGVAVEIGDPEFAMVIIALAAAPSLRKAADTVATYDEMTPSGVWREGMPIRRTSAFEYLVDAVHAACGDLDAQKAVSGLLFEFCETWPEMAVHSPDGTSRFVSAGADSAHWQSGKQRRATTISGTALIQCARELFTEKH